MAEERKPWREVAFFWTGAGGQFPPPDVPIEIKFGLPISTPAPVSRRRLRKLLKVTGEDWALAADPVAALHERYRHIHKSRMYYRPLLRFGGKELANMRRRVARELAREAA